MTGKADADWSRVDMRIVEIAPPYREMVDALIKEEWAGPVIVTKGRTWDTSMLPGFAAVDDDDQLCGAVTYRFEGDECEITSLYSLKERQGIGSNLINKVIYAARERHCRRVWLITTNDNSHAIRFYQRFGFALRAVYINALEKSRMLKPSIPLLGIDNIPLKHEFEFEITL
jgi:ribosomal protein S18 acetylase RimI-like enzyme